MPSIETVTESDTLEPVKPTELEASLRRGLDQALKGESVDVSRVKGLEWLQEG